MKTRPTQRNTNDRRQQDNGPPKGWRERRRAPERRIPELEECTISEADWLLYFGKTADAKVGS